MGMREYGVTGYGIDIESLSNMIDDNKLLKAYAEITEQTEEEAQEEIDSCGYDKYETIYHFIENSNTILGYAEHTEDNEGYVMLFDTLPWFMTHKDWALIQSKDDATEYIWNTFKNVVKNDITEKEFKKQVGDVDDTFFG